MPDKEVCKKCNGRGIIIKNNKAYKCSCVKQEQFIKRYKRANLAGILKDQTFENFNFKFYKSMYCEETDCSYSQAVQKAYNAAVKFCVEIEKGKMHEKGLLFSGSIGSGKTYLASCIANRLLNKGIRVLFTVVPDLLDMLKATYDKSDSDEREIKILDGARNVPLLILDDLGTHNYTSWTKNKIYSIINYRVNMDLPTIITTNENMETLEFCLGERTTSRISQLCNIYMLYSDTDIRILKSKKKKVNAHT